MRQIILGTIALTILLASCKKSTDSTNVNLSNSWSFKNVNYSTSSCSLNSYQLFASSVSPMGGLTIYFPSNPVAGNYTVIGNGSPASNEVYLSMRNNSSSYSSTGTRAGATNQTVSVSIGSTGKVSVTGSNIQMVDGINASDTSALSFSVTQTQ